MGRKRYVIDRRRIDRFIKEGRGQGTGKDYKPWLTVQDVPSNGRVHRPYSFKTGRIHHLLSDIEYRHFLIFDWSEKVYDIREQFPLDLDKTKDIANEMGIRHPKDPRSDEFNVMTSDFLVVIGEGHERRLVACAVKPAAELSSKRVAQKLEIERRYWEAAGDVNWYISTERQISRPMIESLEWIRDAWDLSDTEVYQSGILVDCAHRLLERFVSRRWLGDEINATCADLDTTTRAPSGSHLLIARHLLARKILETNLDRRRVWKATLAEFRVNQARFDSIANFHLFCDSVRRIAA